MKKQLLFVFALLVFGFHFVSTALYLLPANPLSLNAKKWVDAYMAPLFSQNWSLFAPDPAIFSTKIWIRCQDQSAQWSEWIDPLEAIQRKHNQTRITYRGKLLYVYRGAATQFGTRFFNKLSELDCKDEDVACSNHAFQEIETEGNVLVAKRFATAVCQKTIKGTNLNQAQIRLAHLYPKPFSERTSEKPFGKITYFDLPPLKPEAGEAL